MGTEGLRITGLYGDPDTSMWRYCTFKVQLNRWPTIAESQELVWFAHSRVTKAYGVDLPGHSRDETPHVIVVRAPKKQLAQVVEQLSGVLELVNERHRVLDPIAGQTETVADELRWLLSNNGDVAPAGEGEDEPPSSA